MAKITHGQGRFVCITVVEPNARTADGASWILYLNSPPAGDYDFQDLHTVTTDLLLLQQMEQHYIL